MQFSCSTALFIPTLISQIYENIETTVLEMCSKINLNSRLFYKLTFSVSDICFFTTIHTCNQNKCAQYLKTFVNSMLMLIIFFNVIRTN